MMRINVNLYPKDGYVFVEKDGTTIRSTKGWNDLIQRVALYRRLNRIPPGLPEAEVHEQACRANPSYCSQANPPPPTPTSKHSLKAAVLKWLSNGRLMKDKVALVTPEEAARRSSICATCPFNIALKEGCAPCRAFVVEARREILPKRAIDTRVNACEKLAVDAATAAHLDTPAVDQNDLPDHCWMKRKP